jgi:hypothetical protein
MKPTLREAISEYTKWVAAVWSAGALHQIMPDDAYYMLDGLKRELRIWIGEELLNKEL